MEGLKRYLYDIPASYPGCSGTRLLRDNISGEGFYYNIIRMCVYDKKADNKHTDIKAQIAANQKGINLVKSLIDEYSLSVVQAYMAHIRANAEDAVRKLLKEVAAKHKGENLKAVDYMDDGTPICLKITIDEKTGNAIFDFEGTGPEVYGKTNTPESVCYSAIIYCVRCLVAQDIPLNSGCLAPIDIRIPPNSLLSPSETCAVVGGNVLTSQRIVDVVFRAFGACAASQGDCNNLTFGKTDDSNGSGNGWGYYETIAGGHGAGPGWNGQDGVHTV